MDTKNFQTSNLPEAANTDARKDSSRHAGIWILAAVIIVIGMQWVWGRPRLPSDIKTVVKELSSAKIIEKAPIANHAGTWVCVPHTTEKGIGVVFVNVKSQDEVVLQECASSDYQPSRLNLLGWSPDDTLFAYTWGDVLHFCNGITGRELGSISLTNRIQSLSWLSSESCAYIDEISQLHLVQLNNGIWSESWRKPLASDNGPSRSPATLSTNMSRSLVTLSTNIVAWQTDHHIWQVDVASGETTQLFAGGTNRITNISFSKSAGAFLVTETTTNRRQTSILGRVTIGADGSTAEFEEWTRGPSILNAQWINHGKGYAYRAIKAENTLLVIKRDHDSDRETLFQDGQVLYLFCDGESSRAYAVAAMGSEPAGMWECGANADEPQYAFSPWGKEKVDFHFQPVVAGSATYGGRHLAKFDLVPPVNFSRNKKYPLVIGTASYEWNPIAHAVYAQALSRCGAYVAMVEYHWDNRTAEGVTIYTNNVLAVYDQLAANPNVDTSRVYLFGFSAGTEVVKELVEKYPGRWRGIMLMNPSVLPEAKEGTARRVLLTAGASENEGERFSRYQEDLSKIGIPASLFLFQDEGHVVRGQEAFYNRTLLMIDTVFDR
jgi:dipeptidyl aminopeptidase/acylaminoacyl peptidase